MPVLTTSQTKQPEPKAARKTVAHDALVSGVAFALVLTVVQRLVGFVRNILLCKYLTEEQLGQWSLIFSFLFLMAPMTVLGLPGCFGRFVEHYQLRGQLGIFLSRISRICGVSTLLFSLFMCLYPETVAWTIFRDASEVRIVYAIAGSLVSITLINYLTSLMEALRQVRVVTIMRFVAATSFSVASLSLLFICEHSTAAVTWGLGIGSLVACVPAVAVLWKHRGLLCDRSVPLPSMAMWQRIAPYAAWMWLCNLLQNSSEVSDRYMLIHCSPVSAKVAQAYVGQYHGARIIPLVLIGVATMLAGVLMPYLTAHWERREIYSVKRQLNYSVKLTALGFTIAGAFVLVFAPFLFDVILQGRYSAGLAILPITLVYATWFSLFIISKDFLWVTEKGKWAFAAAAVGLTINVALNWIFIPVYGLWGAVGATTIANGLLLAGIYFLNGRFGAKTELGGWIATLAPLLLLASEFRLPLVAILIIVTAMTNLILSEQERQQINDTVHSGLERAAKTLGL